MKKTNNKLNAIVGLALVVVVIALIGMVSGQLCAYIYNTISNITTPRAIIIGAVILAVTKPREARR